MKSTDFRIGNLIVDYKGDVVPIDSGDLLAMAQCEIAKKEVEFIQPVLLTEEWLIKFGFKRQNNAWNGPHKNDFSLWNPKGEEEIKMNDTVLCPRTDYVHQLQNLYFALTGEELILTKQ